MEIMDGRVATIHYTLTDDDGIVIDKSSPESPLSYLHGAGNIVPGLEQALEGKKAGDTLTADVPPELAYGPRHEQLVQQVARAAFPEGADITPGMQFEAHGDQGPIVVMVTEVGDEQVTIDGNHPLAGRTLHFAVEVAGVREPSADELSHGHVHGEGGVHH
ncbi:FKBP-type peptidyl prolyl cis-trans isomerase /Apo-metallochaperone SlyD [Pseudoxanthomonas sp. GM95]|uniref:FKBP-type peptidyl-prolyl cis-trans isomerase n=1 Tax=Pseudoxanthomonas sp. GM95 TaxID=1881043 RepID=UPI0008C10D22|nr:peptidylprolyl isomerase [Pseudoxanthomonas sp. GM95]SEK92444.1 FKBP-type peptidyl prolyl cis-trans isomerase /Apo-metallochaperone SlyD [Pseudoxanthomonas sp. GM95]